MMTMQVLKMNEVDLVSGGFIFNPSTQVIQPLPECQHVGANGKCEDAYTTPPIIPQNEQIFF
jgi:hypothetical protein